MNKTGDLNKQSDLYQIKEQKYVVKQDNTQLYYIIRIFSMIT